MLCRFATNKESLHSLAVQRERMGWAFGIEMARQLGHGLLPVVMDARPWRLGEHRMASRATGFLTGESGAGGASIYRAHGAAWAARTYVAAGRDAL